MKTFSLTKKILFVLIFAVCTFFANSFALITNLYAKEVSTHYYLKDTSKITNGDFATSSSSDIDGKPNKLSSGWKADEQASSSSVNSGVINVGTSTFASTKNNKYGLSENPGYDESINSTDKNILMIQSKTDGAQFAYVSDEIELEASKFYLLSIRCKTGIKAEDNSILYDATASIYTSLSSSENFYNIHTSGAWKTYNFFIATDTFNSSKFNIELRLGSKDVGVNTNGAVFFDYVQLFEISNSDYFTASEDNQRLINLNNDYVTAFDNSDFEVIDDSWIFDENNDNEKSIASILSTSSIQQYIKTNFDESINTNIANTFVHQNNSSLFIANTKETKTKVYSADTNKLNIPQHGFYKLSMLVKTGNLSSGGLDITLTDNGDILTSQTGITSASASSESYNGFKMVDFYIRGNAKKDIEVSLSFSLGNDSNVSGWAIIDNITLEKINESEYNKKSSTNELDLSKNIKNTETILNGSFDFVANKTSTISYPALPTNWKASENANGLSGIIRVRKEYFDVDCLTYGLTNKDNPGPNTAHPLLQDKDDLDDIININKTYENVLMVRNNSNKDVYFTSDSFTFNSSSSSDASVYKIEVAVKTLKNAKAFIRVVDKNGNVVAVKDNITANEWTNYTLFIKNGISSQDVNLELGTHGNGENNYSFFDYVQHTSDIDLSLEDMLSTKNSIYCDLMVDSFYNYSSNKVNDLYTNKTYSAYNLDTNNQSAIYNGILNTSLSNIKTRPDANDKNILVVTNTVSTYQLLTSNYTYKLQANSYYEFSVWIKTDFNDIENLEKSGAIFEIVSVNSDNEITRNEKTRIKSIVTNSEENNGWVKYSIYVLSEKEQTVKVLLGLGNNAENYATEGKVYFDDVKVSDITKTEYASQKASNTTLITKVITTDKDQNNNNSNTSNKEETPSEINIWALLSSIILVIALGFAIAGYLIRRIPKKKVAKVKETEYVKSPISVNENEIKRELKLNREKKLEETNKKLAELIETRDKLQAKYEEESSKEDDLTKKEKLYSSHIKELNKINKEIDYLNSAISYSNEAANIKAEEIREIKKRKKEVIEEFNKLKQEEVKTDNNKTNNK